VQDIRDIASAAANNCANDQPLHDDLAQQASLLTIARMEIENLKTAKAGTSNDITALQLKLQVVASDQKNRDKRISSLES
jgi:hypothetical protein